MPKLGLFISNYLTSLIDHPISGFCMHNVGIDPLHHYNQVFTWYSVSTTIGYVFEKSVSKTPQILYIKHWNPFRACCHIYVSTRWMGRTQAPFERILYKPRKICLKLPTIIYLSHAWTVATPDFPFSSPFIRKRDMPGMTSEEENVGIEWEYYHWKFAPRAHR